MVITPQVLESELSYVGAQLGISSNEHMNKNPTF